MLQNNHAENDHCTQQHTITFAQLVDILELITIKDAIVVRSPGAFLISRATRIDNSVTQLH